MNDANLPPETDAWLDKIILEHGAQIAAKMRAPAPQTACKTCGGSGEVSITGHSGLHGEQDAEIPCPDCVKKPSGEQAEARRVERVAEAIDLRFSTMDGEDGPCLVVPQHEISELIQLVLREAALAAGGEGEA